MAVLVIILLFILLLIAIMAAPVILRVDTDKDDYSIRWGALCLLRAITPTNNPGVGLRVGFWRKRWYLAQWRPESNSNKKIRVDGDEDRKSGLSGKSIRRMWNVIKTFKVSKCDVILDTNDYVLNSQLYPLFHFCNNRWGNWHLNFEGNCRIQLEIESRMINVLYAWWRQRRD